MWEYVRITYPCIMNLLVGRDSSTATYGFQRVDAITVGQMAIPQHVVITRKGSNPQRVRLKAPSVVFHDPNLMAHAEDIAAVFDGFNVQPSELRQHMMGNPRCDGGTGRKCLCKDATRNALNSAFS